MTNACHIRPYRFGDEKGILELRSRVFGDLDPVRRHVHVWKWQFQDNPAGEGVLLRGRGCGKNCGAVCGYSHPLFPFMEKRPAWP